MAKQFTVTNQNGSTKTLKYSAKASKYANINNMTIPQIQAAKKILDKKLQSGDIDQNPTLKNKLVDISTVYSAYEDFVMQNGFEDQSSMLSYLPQVFESQDLANTDVYLLGFSSLTKQARLGIEVLLKKAKSVTAILVEGQNDFAYLNETSDLFRKTCQELGVAFEEKYVKFGMTRKPLKIALRLLGGFALYFGLNAALKLPFPKDFLAQTTMASFLIRTVRYLIVTFLVIGVYPLVFDKIKFKKAAG